MMMMMNDADAGNGDNPATAAAVSVVTRMSSEDECQSVI